MMKSRTVSLLILLLSALQLTGCSSPTAIDSVDDLASALKAEGLDYDAAQSMDMTGMSHAKIEQAVALTGDGLRIEILHIMDTKTYDMAIQAQDLFALGSAFQDVTVIGKATIYARRPYVVVIRNEPTEGQVVAALQKVLPEDLT